MIYIAIQHACINSECLIKLFLKNSPFTEKIKTIVLLFTNNARNFPKN